MDRYRDADVIEMHDSGIILQREGCDTPFGLGDPEMHGETLLVDDEDVGTFLGAFGLEYDRGVRIHRERTLIGSGQHLAGLGPAPRIRRLLARPGDAGTLWIRFEASWEMESGHEERRWREITYCGRYSVWWTSSDAEPFRDETQDGPPAGEPG